MKKTKQKRTPGVRMSKVGVFDILKRDHRTVLKLMETILEEGNRDDGTFTQLRQELQLHMAVEEKYLYPELENEDRTRNLILESYAEHDIGKDLITKISAGNLDEDHWIANLKVLSDIVSHHVQEEEGQLFGLAKRILKADAQQRIANFIEQEKLRSESGEEAAIKEEIGTEEKEVGEQEKELRESGGEDYGKEEDET